ncbi:MAG: bifunctional metallophosphatase/5'-nucleotidase [Clostridia bacterium]|nr:bifunctional metallophosphatase/5'-nucleotidase [Clostridia bacterium]
MKKILYLMLSLMLLMGCVAAFAEEAASGLQKDLVVLFTSDVHCGIDQGWGYAGLYAVKEGLSAKYNVLLVDDGDSIQGEPIGTMTRGESLIKIMNTVGYDVAIPGNHEFDYGMDRFFELVEMANFPYISCNFNKEGEMIFPPYLIKEVDGVKIAFVGVTTPTTLRSSTPTYFMNEKGEFIYGFLQDDSTGEKLYEALQKSVDDARAEGATYVIVIAHLGDEAECIPWTYADVISHTNGIDALLDGHAHDTEQVVMKNKDGEDVVRSACGTKFAHIGALTITTKGEISSKLYSWNQDIPAPEMLNLQNPAADAVREESEVLSAKLKEVVAASTVDLIINDPVAKMDDGRAVRIVRNTETNLGDLCADAYLDQSGDADIAFVNGGGIRVAIPKGDITLNDILKVHPFGNSLTVIKVTGQQVLDALEWSVHAMPGEFGGFNHVAGLTYEVDTTIPTPCVEKDSMFDHIDETMERRIRNVLVAGQPIDPNASYKLASHDYQLLNKGDGYTMYDGCEVLQESVKLDNQVLIDYITGTLNGVIGEEYENPYGQGRFVTVNSAQ